MSAPIPLLAAAIQKTLVRIAAGSSPGLAHTTTLLVPTAMRLNGPGTLRSECTLQLATPSVSRWPRLVAHAWVTMPPIGSTEAGPARRRLIGVVVKLDRAWSAVTAKTGIVISTAQGWWIAKAGPSKNSQGLLL
jgi:hypothetical protein